MNSCQIDNRFVVSCLDINPLIPSLTVITGCVLKYINWCNVIFPHLNWVIVDGSNSIMQFQGEIDINRERREGVLGTKGRFLCACSLLVRSRVTKVKKRRQVQRKYDLVSVVMLDAAPIFYRSNGSKSHGLVQVFSSTHQEPILL